MSRDIDSLRELIRDVPDFPKPGIIFKDISPLLGHAEAFGFAVETMAKAAADLGAEIILGPEARGFIFGVPVAQALGLGFAPIRKPGKLPWQTLQETYALEYGEDTVQMHTDALGAAKRVLLVDDLLATGGTISACRRLVESAGAEVVGYSFALELGFLGGREQLGDVPVQSLLTY